MSKENISRMGERAVTGGDKPGSLEAALKELQGLNVTVIDGAAAGTKMNVPAIRQEDTIIAALRYPDTWAAGNPTDDAANVTIEDLRASGTVTAAAVTAGDTVTVDGKVYTAVANGVNPGLDYTKFSVGANNNECAANLAAAINKRMQNTASPNVSASANLAVVTVKAVAEGTGGNSITLASSNGVRLAVSGATLAGGSATGGIKSTTNNSAATLVLYWLNKK